MRSSTALLGAALALSCAAARAETHRMALVIGVNRGDPGHGLEDLRHAESDALELAGALQAYGGVADGGLKVLTGVEATHDAIFEAAKVLRDTHAAAPADAVFSLFYTGHGVEGGLFTAEPGRLLTPDDISDLLTLPGAGLRVGFFDACHSGALAPDVDAVLPKGAEPTGFNPLEELPVRPGGTGHIIISSSGAGQRSYEDPELGGLFSHYFVEAFTHAAPGRVAVDLDTLVTYAIQHTRATAARRGRRQEPEVVELTRRSDPIFYAFPSQPDARVILTPDVEGCVLVRHAGSQLEARLDPAHQRTARIHSGAIDIEACAPGGTARSLAGLTVRAGDTVEVSKADTPTRLRLWPGHIIGVITGRGTDTAEVEVRHTQTRLTLHGEVGYRHGAMLDPDTAGAHGVRPIHEARLGVWGHYDAWGLGLMAALGRGEQQFDAWGYTARSVDLRGAVTGMRPLGPIGLRLDVAGGARSTDVEYTDGATRTGWDPVFGATGGLMVPLGSPHPAAYLVIDLGLEVLRVDVGEAGQAWEFIPVMGLRLLTGHW